MVLCICRRQCLRTKVCVPCSIVCRLCLSYCCSLLVFSFVGRGSWQNMLEDAVGIAQCDSAAGIVMAEVKKEKRLIMASSESACSPAQVSFKKLLAVWPGFLQGFEPELVWSLPAGKCRQSWYANPEPQIIDVPCNTLVLMYFLRAVLIFH